MFPLVLFKNKVGEWQIPECVGVMYGSGVSSYSRCAGQLLTWSVTHTGHKYPLTRINCVAATKEYWSFHWSSYMYADQWHKCTKCALGHTKLCFLLLLWYFFFANFVNLYRKVLTAFFFILNHDQKTHYQ